MSRRPQAAPLRDGRRQHLHDGPVDLIYEGFGGPGAVRDGYAAAVAAMTGLLDRLCDELPPLRHRAGPSAPSLRGPGAPRR